MEVGAVILSVLDDIYRLYRFFPFKVITKLLRNHLALLRYSINNKALDFAEQPRQQNPYPYSRCIPNLYWQHHVDHIGKVTFIRLVRKSSRITLTADDKFFVSKKYKWQYVQAIVNVQKKKLSFYRMGKSIKSADYR